MASPHGAAGSPTQLRRPNPQTPHEELRAFYAERRRTRVACARPGFRPLPPHRPLPPFAAA
eukprot:365681-Chlamydomonas_euryale.AAC.5